MNKNVVVKQGWARAIIGLIVFYLVIDNSAYVPRLIMRFIDVSFGRLCFVTNSLAFALLAVYLFRKFIDRKSFVSLGFSVKGFGKDILLGLIGSFLLMGTGFLILCLLGNVEITSFNPDFVSLLYWATGLLFAAALEEVPLRGYMLNNMMDSVNKYIAVGIIGVLFGLLHATGQIVNAIAILNCILLGVLVGLYYVYKRNIWLPIVFHTGWNFFQGTIFGFGVSGRSFDYSLLSIRTSGKELVSGGSVGFEGSLILTFLTILTIILVVMSSRNRDAEITKGIAGAIK